MFDYRKERTELIEAAMIKDNEFTLPKFTQVLQFILVPHYYLKRDSKNKLKKKNSPTSRFYESHPNRTHLSMSVEQLVLIYSIAWKY